MAAKTMEMIWSTSSSLSGTCLYFYFLFLLVSCCNGIGLRPKKKTHFIPLGIEQQQTMDIFLYFTRDFLYVGYGVLIEETVGT